MSPLLPTGLGVSCNLSHAVLPVPANQTQIVAPTEGPGYLAMGVGVQNYTCNATISTYAFTGAVAELFDISCLYGTDFLPSLVYAIWSSDTSNTTTQQIISSLSAVKAPSVLGQHYYVKNTAVAAGISPKWDFTSTTGNNNAYMVGAKKADLLSPDHEVNIDTLEVAHVEGDLATTIFRVENNGGQPPSSCSGNGELSVKYVSQYWLYGGSAAGKQYYT